MFKRAFRKFFGLAEPDDRRTETKMPESLDGSDPAEATHIEIRMNVSAIVAVEPEETFQERAHTRMRQVVRRMLGSIDDTMIILNDDRSVTVIYPPAKDAKETIQ